MHTPIPKGTHDECLNLYQTAHMKRNPTANYQDTSSDPQKSIHTISKDSSRQTAESPKVPQSNLDSSRNSQGSRKNNSYQGYQPNSLQSTITSPIPTQNTFESNEYSHTYNTDSSNSTAESTFVAPVSRFEDMRTSAMQFWTTGVNLEFQAKEPPKTKNNGWMTEQEFSTMTKTKVPLSTSSLVSSEEQRDFMPPEISYAQAASKKLAKKDQKAEDSPLTNNSVPEDWYTSDTSQSHQSMGYQTHSFGHVKNTRNSSYNSRYPDPYNDQSSMIEQTEDDKNSYIFVYSVKHQLFGPESLESFQKGIGALLEKIKYMNHRTLDMMIQAMVYSIKEEQNAAPPKTYSNFQRNHLRKVTICDVLSAHLPDFLVAIQSYIKSYIMAPKDFISLLQLFHVFVTNCPDYADQIPLPSVRMRFDQFKQLFTENDMQQMRQLFIEIAALQKVDTWLTIDNLGPESSRTSNYEHSDVDNALWVQELWNPKSQLPSFPSGESLVQELGVLNSDGDRKYIKWQHMADAGIAHVFGTGTIPNMISTPWPKTRLDIYLATQYEILRELLCGPARYAIENYISSTPLTKQGSSLGSSISDVQIYSTSLPATLVEPVVIFKFRGSQENIDALKRIQNGSLAILIPQTIKKRCTPKHLASISRQIITGIVVGSTLNSHTQTELDTVQMIAIHFKVTHLLDLQRSAMYTILTTSPNSSSILPVLSWLRKEVNQYKGESALTEISNRLLSVIPPNSQANHLPKKNDSFTDSFGKTNSKEDTSDTPHYLRKVELDISCIIQDSLSGNKAYMEKNVWPQLQHKHLWLPISERPFLYTLSKSQITALKYALFHRLTVIGGGPGTGKTYLASKLINLVHQGLVESQIFYPIVVITKNEKTLDEILERNMNEISGLVRLGLCTKNKTISSRQGVRLFVPESKDQNHRHVIQMERRQAMLQADLDALWKYRFNVLQGDLAVITTFVPPVYMNSLEKGCPASETKQNAQYGPSILKAWMKNTDVPMFCEDQDTKKDMSESSSVLEETYDTFLNSIGNDHEDRMSLIMDPVTYNDRLEWIIQKRPTINSIADPSNWPLPNSHHVSVIRNDVLAIWSEIPPENLWKLVTTERKELWVKLVNKIIHHIDSEITKYLEDQFKVSKALDKARLQKWSNVCRYSRLIGMTAEFAASNQEFVSSLSPSVVIVDEANEILESTLSHFIFGPRLDHLVLLGDDTKLKTQPQKDGSIDKNIQNLDVSLFERWYLTGGKIVPLQEQWRMCTEVLNVFRASNHNMPTLDHNISGPSTNLGDKGMPSILGFDNRTFFISHDTDVTSLFFDDALSTAMGIDITESMADGARYVCHLALYILQQGIKSENLVILVADPLQKMLIERILGNELLDFSRFIKRPLNVDVSMIDDYEGKESWISIISLTMPDGKRLVDNNVPLALSRARYGLYIVGDAMETIGTKWEPVAEYMKSKGNCSPNLQLRCQKHKDRTTVISYWPVFSQVRNGGCGIPCETLMECGHVCKNVCHILDHSYVSCVEPCVRPRAEGCSHPCPNSCNDCSNNGEECPPCTEAEVVKFPCGHERSINCRQAQLKEPSNMMHLTESTSVSIDNTDAQNEEFQLFCTENCNSQLECGHLCTNMCRTPHSHESSQCQASCPKQLICGHNCSNGCARPNDHTEMCLEACQQVCSHGYKCGRDCWRVCTPCVEICPYICTHNKCTKRCHEKCDRPPCDEACSNILSCSHPCTGLCGELCPPCRECHPDIQCAISLRTLSEFEPDEKSYVLPECKCVFSVEYLDMYFKNQAQNGKHNSIKLWQCPLCQTPIYTALRYNMYIKTEIALVNKIKESQNKKLQSISENEKQDIIKAMNDETRFGIHNIVGGRWFVCKNQHPYFIGDCGGATEVSSCPQCGETIGGLHHKVVDSNRFYGEFDGSNGPAWPGQPLQ
ncbi:hypothetical protein CLU79DRAFT_750289 [Phycomyces nitens]|nr:hypothetical protein CLU79DRAFT_750289 [Phycomyces nitens]